MRFTQQGIKQMTAEQKASVKPFIEKGAKVFGGLEESAREDKLAARGLAGIFDAVRDAGFIGPLECHALKLRAKTIAESHEADWLIFHSDVTLRCQAVGIDTPPLEHPDIPAPMSGSPR